MSENPQYIGNLKKMMSKNNTEYFKGKVGNVPVVAFWGRKDPDQLNIKLDVGLIKWIDEQEPREKRDEQRTPQANNETPFGQQGDDEPLPF
jgi:hypothetical protein